MDLHKMMRTNMLLRDATNPSSSPNVRDQAKRLLQDDYEHFNFDSGMTFASRPTDLQETSNHYREFEDIWKGMDKYDVCETYGEMDIPLLKYMKIHMQEVKNALQEAVEEGYDGITRIDRLMSHKKHAKEGIKKVKVVQEQLQAFFQQVRNLQRQDAQHVLGWMEYICKHIQDHQAQ